MEKTDFSHIEEQLQQNREKAEIPPQPAPPIAFMIADGLAKTLAKNIFDRQKAELGDEVGSEKLRLSEEDLTSILCVGFKALLQSVAAMIIPLAPLPQKPEEPPQT